MDRRPRRSTREIGDRQAYRPIGLCHMGDAKSIGNGIVELRVHMGPGYRVYFTQMSDAIVVLLCGGDKRSQARDITRAQALMDELHD
jgi:putative addiction module killer protein